MNALARYLLVFLLGWSGAVWSYSDIIYKKEAPSKKIETPKQTNDISLPDSLKPKPEVISEPTSQEIQKDTSPTTVDNKQSIEEQTLNQ